MSRPSSLAVLTALFDNDPAMKARFDEAMRLRGPQAPAESVAHNPESAHPLSTLTERELQVLRLVDQGLRTAQVAQVLDISRHTVTTHLNRIYQKLAVNARGAALHEARARGIL